MFDSVVVLPFPSIRQSYLAWSAEPAQPKAAYLAGVGRYLVSRL